MLLALVLMGCEALTVEAEPVMYVFPLASFRDSPLCSTPGAGMRLCAMQGRALLTAGPAPVDVTSFDGVERAGAFLDARVEIGALVGSWRIDAHESVSAPVVACVTCWDGEIPKAGAYEGEARWTYDDGEADGLVSARVVAVLEE